MVSFTKVRKYNRGRFGDPVWLNIKIPVKRQDAHKNKDICGKTPPSKTYCTSQIIKEFYPSEYQKIN